MTINRTDGARGCARSWVLAAAAALSVLEAAACYAEAPSATARTSIPELMHGISTLSIYQETAISPDRRNVAWAQAAVTPGSTEVGSSVYVQSLDGGASWVLSAKALAGSAAPGAVTEKAIAWAPDGRSIAFLSDAAVHGQLELYVMRLADRSVRRLTNVKGFLAAPLWSPDGRTVAVLFTEHAVRVAGPLSAAAPAVGVIDDQIYEQRVMTVDAASGASRVVSPANLYVYEYDWSPHADQIVATAAPGSGDNNWYTARLMVFDVMTGSARTLLQPSMQIAAPRWSPDGRSVAFIGGLSSDEGIASGEIYEMPAAGGEPRNLTPGLAASAYSLAWRRGSREIVFAEAIDGGSGFALVNDRTLEVKQLWRGAETVRGPLDLARGLSLASDGQTSAVIRESFDEPPGIWTGAIGAWKRLTPIPPVTVPWGAAQSVHWRSDEFSVQGWLVPPAHVDPARKYPMVVVVHGGPAWLTAPNWPAPPPLADDYTWLASQGYYVFYPNPRGSAGFGERFKRANIKDFGGGDLRDILAGVDEVVRESPVDDHRVGLTGWSYGGYMTMWALTQTTRFRAAVVGAGLSDWLSYYGENGIDEWMLPYFGASVYDDPAVYAKSSPIDFVKRVRTPALLVVGDGDVECPPPQSFEYWHAIKSFGVKTQLVVYPNEGHRFADPVHALDVMQRMIRWFDENMPPDGAP
ncbi:MAG TPA: S9 family peptidase [Steroidobacteraceae bacterium]|nr:S9 family peptidase [Steroidobacteraceae bacterium]